MYPSATARPYPGAGRRDTRDRALRPSLRCERLPRVKRGSEEEQRVATLVCLECADESDETPGWRAYLDDGDVLIYCAHCATREFGP